MAHCQNAGLSFLIAVLFALLAPVHAARADEHAGHGAPHWEYSGPEGPDHWGDLDPSFAACKNGKSQSPINIDGAKKAALQPIQFDYKPSPLKIINNGHTIQINYDPGSSITVGGKQYSLIQFHFHRPSEEMIHGRQFDMVIHLVHQDSAGNPAVVGILVKSGKENATIQKLWGNLPEKAGKERDAPNVTVDAAQLLPADRNYYSFAGSLTTPPCTEGVSWYLFSSPVEFSAGQIATFAKIYPMNARPTQPANGREILESGLKR